MPGWLFLRMGQLERLILFLVEAMDSVKLFTMALQYEERVRDLYKEAVEKIDDERGKSIFNSPLFS